MFGAIHNRFGVGVLGFVSVVLWSVTPGRAQSIPPGFDYLETTAGSSRVRLGGISQIPPLPAEFFFTGSAAWEGIIELRGEPLPGACGAANTVVERKEEATMPGPATVEIELRELALVSTAPIEVMDMGGGGPYLYDVKITVNPDIASLGFMTIEGLSSEGGMYSFAGRVNGGISVHARLIFEARAGEEPPVVWDPPEALLLESAATGNPWQYAEPPLACVVGNQFYAVPDVPIPTVLDGGDTGEHGVIPPREPDGCCLPDGNCVNIDPVDCSLLGGIPQGMLCTGMTIACCLDPQSDPDCVTVDLICCDDEGGTPSPTGAPQCLGDGSGNGIDDACEEPCEPDDTGQACRPVPCPDAAEVCVPRVVRRNLPGPNFPLGAIDVLTGTAGEIVMENPFGVMEIYTILADVQPNVTQVSRSDPIDMGGFRMVDTEIVEMELIAGGGGGGGGIAVHLSSTQPSTGQVVGAAASDTDYPADSFFDVFVTVDLLDLPGAVGLHHSDPIPLESYGQTSMPPWGAVFETSADWAGTELLDATGLPTGYIIRRVIHIVPPPPPPWEVIACECRPTDECHVEFDAINDTAYCVGTCPPGMECNLIGTDTDGDGADDTFECLCAIPVCPLPPDSLDCLPWQLRDCTDPMASDFCLPKVVRNNAPGPFFPLGAIDVLTGTAGEIEIENPFGLTEIYTILMDVQPNVTQVSRSDPMDMGGFRMVDTEIVEMELIAGGGGGGGGIAVHLSSTQPSTGQVVGAAASDTDYPADSFFDVFVTVDLLDLPGAVGLHHSDPIPLESYGQTSMPPWGAVFETSADWAGTELLDATGLPTGYIIRRVIHIVPPPPPPWEVILCDCMATDACHVVYDPASPDPVYCVGSCPPGEDCNLIGTDTDGDGLADTFTCVCQPSPVFCPIGYTDCIQFETRDCLATAADETCLPKVVQKDTMPPPVPVLMECDCFAPGGCGAVSINGNILSCPGDCPPPPPGEICQIFVNGIPWGQTSVDINDPSIPPGAMVTCDCALVPTGACCHGTMHEQCVQATAAECAALGGVYEGDDTLCQGIEACCLPIGKGTGCIDADALCCVNELGGTPQGPGTACTPDEACCFGTDHQSCTNIDPLCCVSELIGLPQGPFSECTQPQACCLENGTCLIVDPYCCDEQGGTPQGPGTTCGDIGGCCFDIDDGPFQYDFCADGMDRICCDEAGGVQDGTTCTLEPCCLEGGSHCQMGDPECCLASGGFLSPSGAQNCLGDHNGNGIDDACEVPGVPPAPERGYWGIADAPDCQAGVKFCHDLSGGGSGIPCTSDAECLAGEVCWDDCWGEWRAASCIVYDHNSGAARCYIPKNRFLAIDPTVNADPVAYHFSLAQLDDQYENPLCLPLRGWLSEPVCRDSNVGCPVVPQPSPTDPCQGPGMFGWVSFVVEGPMIPRIWSEYPLFVAGCEVTPAATYEIRSSPDGIAPMDPPLVTMTSHDPIGNSQHWGDMTSVPGAVLPWLPPEYAMGFSDISALIRTFEKGPNPPNVGGGPPRAWCDFETNLVVSFGDIQFAIKAFEGKTYPQIADISGGCSSEPSRPLIGHEPCECPPGP